MYRVNESNGTVEITASLSNPSMTDITVQILSNDITAMSESYAHHTLYFCLSIQCMTHTHTHTYVHISALQLGESSGLFV